MNNAPENKDYANSVPYYINERKKNHYPLTHALYPKDSYSFIAFLSGVVLHVCVLYFCIASETKKHLTK